MMQPKKRKYTKEFRGSMHGLSYAGSTLSNGEFGLQAVECGWIESKQIEAARKAIVNHTKRRGKTWIKIFPHKPVTFRAHEMVTMGGGKGNVDKYVAVIKPARILFEIGGLPEDIAVHSLKLAAQKLPIKTRIITK
jgi:large subunit ribosomal protein L16